jgi:hypothetical protein
MKKFIIKDCILFFSNLEICNEFTNFVYVGYNLNILAAENIEKGQHTSGACM